MNTTEFNMNNQRFQKKIEVASGLDRVTDCINKGPVGPLFKGGGEGLSAFCPKKL